MAHTRRQLESIRDASLAFISLRATWGCFTDLATKYLVVPGGEELRFTGKILCLIGRVIWKCWCQLEVGSTECHPQSLVVAQPGHPSPTEPAKQEAWVICIHFDIWVLENITRKAANTASTHCWRSASRPASWAECWGVVGRALLYWEEDNHCIAMITYNTAIPLANCASLGNWTHLWELQLLHLFNRCNHASLGVGGPSVHVLRSLVK